MTRHLALSAIAAALAIAPLGGGAYGVHATMASSSPGVPSASSSFYVYGSFIDECDGRATTGCPLYDDGASAAVSAMGGMTILDFGAPCFEPATLAWGTQLFNSQSCTPDGVIVILAQAWVRGYETNPRRLTSPNYVLVAGTSNSLTAAVPGNALTPDQMSSHAQAWYTSVVRPIAARADGLPTPVTIWAGDDIEESRDGNWYDGPTTIAWVDAYAAASDASKPCAPTRSYLMVDYGDYVPNVPGWSPAAVYHVSWQAAPACPVPEIYDATNASEWESLNGYASSAGLPQLQFTGVLSEDGAAGSLASSDSWDALRSATGQSAPYVNVIGTTGPIPPVVPDPPSLVTAIPGPGLVTVGWSAPAWDGGARITTYTVTVYDGWVLAQVVTVSGLPAPEKVIVTGLDDGTPYTFWVSATNQAGTGLQSLPSDDVVPSGLTFLR
jgi:hypothetical protein